MQLIRTTLRIPYDLKKTAESMAFDANTTLQDVFHKALNLYVKTQATKKAQRIVFKTHNIGKPLDHFTRASYYAKP